MPHSKSSIDELLPAIGRALGDVEGYSSELKEHSSVLDALHGELVERIEVLLQHRRELLMSMLYRIDVEESLVVETFRNLPPDQIARRLADLVIERQVQKVQSRRTYRDSNP